MSADNSTAADPTAMAGANATGFWTVFLHDVDSIQLDAQLDFGTSSSHPANVPPPPPVDPLPVSQESKTLMDAIQGINVAPPGPDSLNQGAFQLDQEREAPHVARPASARYTAFRANADLYVTEDFNDVPMHVWAHFWRVRCVSRAYLPVC